MKKILLNVTIEFGPLIGFFIVSEITSFICSTVVLVALMTLSMIASTLERGRFAPFPVIAGLSIIGFGIFTIIFKDPFYLIIKDTLYNGIFAIVLFHGVLKKKGLLKYVFGDLFAMTDYGWYVLSFRWMIMFILLTVSNEYVRIFYTSEQWIMYKGLATLATIIFALYQFTLARRERLPEATKWGMKAI